MGSNSKTTGRLAAAPRSARAAASPGTGAGGGVAAGRLPASAPCRLARAAGACVGVFCGLKSLFKPSRRVAVGGAAAAGVRPAAQRFSEVHPVSHPVDTAAKVRGRPRARAVIELPYLSA